MTIDRRARIGLEIRAGESGQGHTVRGYAAVYGQRAEIAGLFTEEIAPGAFARSLTEGDVRALYQHDRARPIGRMSTGTLRLVDEPLGLRTEIDLPDAAADVLEAIRRGDVDGMSFGFRATEEEWQGLDTDMPHRIVRAADLIEVSPVTFPAYQGASIGLRDADAAKAAEDLEAQRSRRAEAETAAAARTAEDNRLAATWMDARLAD